MWSKGQRRRNATIALAHFGACLMFLIGDAQAQERKQSPEHLHVEVVDGLVTVSARDSVTGEILDKLARESGLRIVSDVDLLERASVNIDRQPLPEALRVILRRQSFALRYVPSETWAGQMHSSTLWILQEQANAGSHRKKDSQPISADPGSRVETYRIELNDPDFRIRREAILGLANLGGNEVVAPLSFALGDANLDVRLEAVSALAEVGTEQAAAALATALSDEQPEVQAEALLAIAEIGGSTAVRLLEETLSHSNKNLREAAIQGFADIGGDDAVRALGIALHDEDPTLREGAVDALGLIGGEAAVGLLRQVLADNDPVIRSAAADILEELSPPGAVTQ